MSFYRIISDFTSGFTSGLAFNERKIIDLEKDGQPMDEFDLVCFQYTQCLRCLDIDQCTHGVYKGYNEKNEFCNASEYGCENNLCKCQKKLIQGTWYILLFNFMPHLGPQ